MLSAYEKAFRGARKVDENLAFSDENFIRAFMTIICLMLVIICALGLAGQYLKDKNDDLKDVVEQQQEEIDYLYSQLGIDKPVVEE